MSETYDIGGGGGKSFPFDNFGDSVTGRIVGMEYVDQTDPDTNKPKTFDNGDPMKMWRVTLQTELREDGDDDGVRNVYLKGSKKSDSKSTQAATLDAVKAATGGTKITAGATLTLTYVGDGERQSRTKNPPKLYEAVYVPPSADLAGTQPAQQAAPAAQQPAATPAAQAPAQPAQQAAPAAAAEPVYGNKDTGAVFDAAQVAAMRSAGVDVEAFRLA